MEYFIKFQLTTEFLIIAAEIVVLLVLAAIYSAYFNVKAILQGKVKVLNGVQIKMQNVKGKCAQQLFLSKLVIPFFYIFLLCSYNPHLFLQIFDFNYLSRIAYLIRYKVVRCNVSNFLR